MAQIIKQIETPCRLFEKGTGRLLETRTDILIEFDDGSEQATIANLKKYPAKQA